MIKLVFTEYDFRHIVDKYYNTIYLYVCPLDDKFLDIYDNFAKSKYVEIYEGLKGNDIFIKDEEKVIIYDIEDSQFATYLYNHLISIYG